MIMPFPPSFILFSKLPIELRLQIWRFSCPRRVVEVVYNPDNDRCTTTASTPAVLQTCHESRSEALRLYQRSFSTITHEPEIYFCPEMDTLYIPRPPFMGYDDTARSFMDSIRHTDGIVNLAIDYVPPSIKRPWETYNKYVLMHSFPNIHEVFLVIDTAVSADDGRKLDLTDPAIDTAGLDQVLEDVRMSFYYEVGGQFERLEKGVTVDSLHLPSLVWKLKTWTCW